MSELTIKRMLNDFLNSYVKKEKELKAGVIGFKIDDDWWHIKLSEHELVLGKPEGEVVYFETDYETLTKIYKKELLALTAMGKAWNTDPAPMEIRHMNHIPNGLDIFQFIFRFFLVGELEMAKLGKQYSRIVHDGYAIPLIYSKGLRTAWYRVDKGMQINEKEEDQINPFHTLIIVTDGSGIAKLNGEEINISKKEAYFIPEGMTHTFWTEEDDGLEFIIIMYGEKA